MSKIIPLALAGAVLAVSGGTLGAAQAFAKDVTLVVDGVPTQVRVLDATVAQVLIAQHITLSEHDVVTPAVTERVANGSQVTVSFARPVTVTVDGRTETRWTTATTVDGALAQLALRADNGRLSVSRSMPIGREGATFALDTAKHVKVVTKDATFNVELLGTVKDALAKAGVYADPDDKVDKAPDTPVAEGMTITVVTVEVKRTTKPVELPFQSTTQESADLLKGDTKVATEGKAGQVVEVWEQRLENGVEVSNAKVGEESRTEPVNQVTLVGTKVVVATPTPTPVAAAPTTKAPTTQAPAATAAPAPTVAPAPVVAAAPVYGGTHADWMAAAGIAASDYSYVEVLIQRESGWNPNAVNPYSGACGLVQALPCSKLGPSWNNPVVALQWGNSYVASRYGGWAGAWAHSQSYGWY